MSFLPFCGFAQNNLYGSWKGHIDLGGMKLDIFVKFFAKDQFCEATIDIPAQGAKNLPLDKVICEKTKTHFELVSPIGKAIFEGVFVERKNEISGTFQQAAYNGTFLLQAYSEQEAIEKLNKERANFHFVDEEITFENDGITFSGTLSKPKNAEKPLPALVLITGSGAQNRDEEILGFKLFQVISNEFTKHGFAVLRYDDRGVGKTKGGNVNMCTTADFAKDAAAAVDLLKSRKDIDPAKIALLGHSEGGNVAPLVLNHHKNIAFLILMAGTGVSGADVMTAQSKAILKASGVREEEAEKTSQINQKIYAAAMNGEETKAAELIKKASLEQFSRLPSETKSMYLTADSFADENVKIQMRVLMSPWMRFFMRYNPSNMLEKVQIPVLLLFGEKDLQVLPTQNREPMENALKKAGNKHFKTVVFDNANHLFEKSATGNMNEYGTQKEFVSPFFPEILSWLKEIGF